MPETSDRKEPRSLLIKWGNVEKRIWAAFEELEEAAKIAKKGQHPLEIEDLIRCLQKISDTMGDEIGRGYPMVKVALV
jgi:hypothetical protein